MLSITSDGVEVIKNVDKQVQFAKVKTINELATITRRGLVAEMRRVFRNPTAWTLGGIEIKYATKQQPEGKVGLKYANVKGTPVSKYLTPQVYGGNRPERRTETWLREAGILPRGMYVVPGKGAKKNKYGNMDAGQYTMILSLLKALPDKFQNTSKNSKKRNKKLPNIFVIKTYEAGFYHGKLLPGVYQRTANGIKPLLIFVNNPHYKIRFKMYEKGREIINANYKEVFGKSLAYAYRTAKGTP